MPVMLQLSFYLSALLILVAPLYYAGRTAGGQLLIEFLGVLLLFCLIWGKGYSKKLFGLVWVYLFISIALVLVYLLPVSFEFWQGLPGRGLYAESFLWLQRLGLEMDIYQISIIPSETVLSLLILVPAIGMFISASSLPEPYLKRLIYLLLAMASFQAILGLIQSSSGNSFFDFGLHYTGNYAQGMYANRNHFAGLLEMGLPIALGLMLYSVGRGNKDLQRDSFVVPVNEMLLFGIAAMLFFIAAIFSKSRTGIFLVLLMVLLSSLLFARHIGGKRSAGWASFIVVASVGVASSIGLIPVLNRFIEADPSEDARWPIFKTTLTAIRDFFPIGSGPGTYAEVYRAFQPADQVFYVNHAHNDYLELLVEMGASGVFIIVGFLVVYLYGWIRLRKHAWNRMRFIQVGSGLGILAILLHSLVDFNLHITANLIVFSFLCGVFLRKNRPPRS